MAPAVNWKQGRHIWWQAQTKQPIQTTQNQTCNGEVRNQRNGFYKIPNTCSKVASNLRQTLWEKEGVKTSLRCNTLPHLAKNVTPALSYRTFHAPKASHTPPLHPTPIVATQTNNSLLTPHAIRSLSLHALTWWRTLQTTLSHCPNAKRDTTPPHAMEDHQPSCVTWCFTNSPHVHLLWTHYYLQ